MRYVFAETVGCAMTPTEKVFIGSGEPIESENRMEFRLLFQGTLPPSAGQNRRGAEKHEIRRTFHPQLKRLWNNYKGLKQYASNLKWSELKKDGKSHGHWWNPEWVNDGIELIGKRWNRGGVDFVPLVTPDFALRCAIDVLLLRPGPEDIQIMRQGDIDGQLKTILDALRIPEGRQEMDDADPSTEEQPFFCLLSDDRLISRVRVVTDQLLMLPNQREVRANDAFSVIHVELNHLGGSPFDRWFD
jgi:hypothetical protein